MSLKVYKASAGSGKTYRLALEYIALALQTPSPNNYSKILAVTFTNMATAEMKDRILIQLYNLADGGKDKNFMADISSMLNISPAEVKERAKKTLKAIIHDYDSFRVETIDSFFQSLLSNLAYELKLSRTFRVDLDTNEVISRAVDEMLLSVGGKNQLTPLILKYMQDHIDQSEGWNISRELKSLPRKIYLAMITCVMKNVSMIFYQTKKALRNGIVNSIRNMRIIEKKYLHRRTS